ncbi:hypothetical protein ACLJJ6_08220 [Pediococcus siamensis]|uniref:hypothetical protein n=1 Tax=Pediococcus siamensis TaxID=381829 RepID=UPI0039A20BCF
MTLRLSMKRGFVALLALLAVFSLTACSKRDQASLTSSSTESSSSTPTNQKKATALLTKAQKEIENGKTTTALATLKKAQKLDSNDGKVNELLANVQNYLAAKAALNDGDTSSAESSLNKISTEQAKSPALTSQAKTLTTQAKQLEQANSLYQSAYDAVTNGYYETAKSSLAQLNALPSNVRAIKKLQDQGAALTNQINVAQSSSSSAATSSSSSSTTSESTSSSSSSQTTGSLSDSQIDSIITSFQSAAGLSSQSGLSYSVSQVATNSYQIEVRQDNSTNTVGSLTGIYRYNTQTGSVSKLNTISGKYETN